MPGVLPSCSIADLLKPRHVAGFSRSVSARCAFLEPLQSTCTTAASHMIGRLKVGRGLVTGLRVQQTLASGWWLYVCP